MSWSYVGTFQAVGGTAQTYSPSFIGSLAEHDLVMLCFSSKSDGVTPAQLSIGEGWTLLHASESATTSEPGLHVWYSIAGAGGSIPSTTVTRTGGERHQCFGFAYRNTGGAPVKLADAVAVKLASSTTATLTGGINPSAAGSLLISVIAGGVVGVPNNITATSPSAYSASSSTTTTVSTVAPALDEWVQRFGSSSTAGSDHSHGLADAVKAAAGSTGSITWTKAAASINTVFAVAFGPSGSGGDTTAPTLTSPTASATGATTASGSVTTNEANGTLYYLASTNASEPVATVKTGSSQAVSESGVQNVTVTGLAASTSYYLHFVHTDAAANDSTVATSAQITTSAAGDTTPPTLTGPTGTATGATTASGTVSTNEDTGTLYWLASANASETGTAVKAGGSQAVSAVGTQNVTVSGLTASTAYYLHYLHRDGAGNDSTVATSAQFTTSAAPDTTAPTLTGAVTFASITQTSYTAQWPAGSDNVAVAGYEYQIGGTGGAWTDAGNSLSAAITGRTAGTTETVYVRAYDAAGNRSTPAISGEVTLLAAVAGITVTEPLKNNTGTLLASQSGVRVAVLQAADLVSVYETTGLTTNASGVLSTISDAAITTGQQYHVAIKLADGGVGITGPITAS